MEPVNTPSEKTFTSYTSAQATTYASSRPSYSPALYDLVLSHHAATGGTFGTLLDVGCGPGNATRDLAVNFEEAIGCDAGEGMILAATKLGGKCKSGKDVKFAVASGEDFSKLESVRQGVDLLTVASKYYLYRS
jgi:SAM-dependent methyltransferase